MKDNREKILASATRLFNERGTAEVSTNHICEDLSISPGSLYYHFRSKDEIIVMIFQRMIDKWEQSPLPEEPCIDSLFFMYERTFRYLWEYRFIHREISALYKRISEFRIIFDKAQKKRLKEIQIFLGDYSKAGIFRALDQTEIKNLARTIWFFPLYWMAYLETEGKNLNQKTVKESVGIIKNIIQPYLKKEQ